MEMNVMETRSDWYHRTAQTINSHKITLEKKAVKKYKLDLLLRLAAKVDNFANICGECQNFKQEITRLTASLGGAVQLSKEERKSYSRSLNTITKHLQKEHKLVTEGHYLGIGMMIGAGIGTILGNVLDNTGIGTPLGIAIGLAVGSYLDKKAKKEGRVI